MNTPKREMLELLERMPDDVPMETLLAEMHFKASVLRGLEEASRGDVVPHDEVERRVREWRRSQGREKLFEI